MKILFLCASNIFRSQMAETFFNTYTKKHQAISAALIKPQNKMHNLVIKSMKEKGFDITDNISKKATKEMINNADKIILMSPNLREYLQDKFNIIEWNIPDVIAKETDYDKLKDFISARDTIEGKVKKLILSL